MSTALFQIKLREVMNSTCDPTCTLHMGSIDHCLPHSKQDGVLKLYCYLGEHLIYGRGNWEAQCCNGSLFQSPSFRALV